MLKINIFVIFLGNIEDIEEIKKKKKKATELPTPPRLSQMNT